MIGTSPDKVPTHGDLGRMAYQDPGAVVLELPASATPMAPRQAVLQYNGAFLLTIRVMNDVGQVVKFDLTGVLA